MREIDLNFNKLQYLGTLISNVDVSNITCQCGCTDYWENYSHLFISQIDVYLYQFYGLETFGKQVQI